MDEAAAGIPARIGRYTVERQVAAGVFGRLFRAHDPALGRWVAVKLFSLSAAAAAGICYDVAEWRRRFVVEARVLARFDHPHIVRVEELGWHDGEPFMVMPYLDANLRGEIGADVDDPALPPPLKPHAIRPARAAEILAQLLSALVAIHAAGMVHRDLKPANLLLTGREGGTVKLCDFGYVKVPGQVESQAEVWFGSPDYMSPEQGRSAAAATDRSDVYSAGVLAWRMLAGVLPSPGAQPPGALPPGLPAGFVDIVRAALSPSPAARPSAAEMLGRLIRQAG
jgi:serine/threonine-protein kinase